MLTLWQYWQVQKYCTRLDIVVWPSFPAPLSIQVEWSAFRVQPFGEKVACKSICEPHSPRGSTASLMERIATVFQEAVSN